MFHGVCIHTPTTTSHTKVTGIKIFQPKRMIWSYRKRGKVTRTQMNRVIMKNVLMPSQIQPGIQLNKALSMGAIQPPKNKVTDMIERIQMLAYSAIWNMAQDMTEYSTMWPATISDSPSITSKGVQ